MLEQHQSFKVTASKKNKNVDIEDIDLKFSDSVIESIHENVFFNRKIYCRGLKNLSTPQKALNNNVLQKDEFLSTNNGAERKSNLAPEKCPAIEVNLSKSDKARATKME